MGVKELRRELAVRRVGEGVVATVVGGLILWSLTSAMPRSTPTAEKMGVTAAPAIHSTTMPDGPMLVPAPAGENPVPQIVANAVPTVSIAGPTAPVPLAKASVPAAPIPAGPILLYEDFSRYREGDATDWGPNTSIKMGLDRRHWLISKVEGTHTVGRRMQLPGDFCFECRYSVYMPQVTRGILGWWKEPVATTISLLNERGGKYTIAWAIRCGNDPTRLNPLGSPSLCAKTYYHAVTLPDGTANEIACLQPTGILRIDCRNKVVRVFFDGQVAVVGAIGQLGQLVGFAIDVVKAKNGSLFFTDFKIARY